MTISQFGGVLILAHLKSCDGHRIHFFLLKATLLGVLGGLRDVWNFVGSHGKTFKNKRLFLKRIQLVSVEYDFRIFQKRLNGAGCSSILHGFFVVVHTSSMPNSI